ncbi:MAG: phage tail protein, partial [Calditrichota bacterium]
WLNSIQSGNLKRENIVISLLDESDSPTMVWTIINAWPITITGTNLSTNEHVVAVETIEIAHEGLTIKNV